MRFSAAGATTIMAATAAATAFLLPPSVAAAFTIERISKSKSGNHDVDAIIIRRASLRDLLGTPDDKNYEILSKNNKQQTSKEHNAADNFSNLLNNNPLLRDSNNDDSGAEEMGLNMDRLRAFSFAGQIAPENTRVKKRVNRDAVMASVNNNDDINDVKANDFNNMIGIAYSKKSSPSLNNFNTNRNPITQQISNQDIDQESGMHTDKVSTFSFSSSNSKSAFLGRAVSGSNGGNSLREFTWASNNSPSSSSLASTTGNIGGESKEERQKRMKEEVIASAAASAAAAITTTSSSTNDSNDDGHVKTAVLLNKKKDIDATSSAEDNNDDIAIMKVDNFHNMVNVNMSKNTGLKRLIYAPQTPDGQVNHADRMATFSLLSTEDGNAAGDGGGSSIGSGSTPPDSLDTNHGDRLGTFSFASSTASGNPKRKITISGNKKQVLAAAAVVREVPAVVMKESESKPLGGSDDNDDDDDIVTNESYSQVYTPPQKGSLSSLASSLKTKSRVDRIQEIKILTDPKLLHPDGMNVPRLNAKGDVMSMSSTTGRKNIFQRIDLAKQSTTGQNDIAGGKIVAERTKGQKDSSDGNDKDGDDKDKGDIVGKAGKGSNNDDETSNAEECDHMDQSPNGGDCFIGFDLGTSGARMSIVEKKSAGRFDEVVTEALSWDSSLQFDNANDWRKAIDNLLSRAKGKGKIDRVKAICVSGTSATCLLVKRHTLDVSRKARMYNFDVKAQSSTAVENVMALIEKYVPEKHTARATTGTLAKLLLWSEEKSLVDEVLCHQSDYVSLSLMYEGHHGDEKDITTHCDFHNILKLGYDVRALEYPLWMMKLLKEGANIPHPEDVLPSKVISPGEPIGIISPVVAAKYGLSSDVVLVGGTTDSNAAFFAAAGANPEYGTAVTSLGSTMAIKQLSSTYVEDASRGVYSHRFPRFGSSGGMESNDGKEEEAWLIGGASNVGCAVLRSEDFSNEELTSLSLEIDPNEDSPLSYYPLIKAGERFPVADSTKEPVLSPKPASRKEYLHGILQGIGDVERDGFKVLGDLGATPKLPKVVLSCGGGSKNEKWIAMRQRRLKEIYGDDKSQDVVVKRATNTEASYGAALLAAATFLSTSK